MEIELKLALDPGSAAGLPRHPALAATKAVRRRLRSVYLDTPNWDLMRHGVALRLRRAGRRWLQTLKAESASVGALTRRPEWEVELPRGHHDLGRFPPEAQALLAALSREGVALDLVGPAFVTDFQRTAWLLEHGGATMEVALDVGEIRAGSRSQPLCEVEIELKAGAREALFDLALELLARVPMAVEPRSKAVRGYALAGALATRPVKAGAIALDPGLDAGQAWGMLAEAALAQMVSNVPGFLLAPEEIEYLHQARIGLRRLRAVAGLAPGLGRAPPAWDGGLKALMAQLNGARDWDVLLHETLPRLERVLVDPPLGQALRRRLAREAEVARETARAAFSNPEFTRLVLEIGRDLLSPPPGGEALQPWAAACLEKHWRKTRQRGKGFSALDAAGRHRLRLAAKRLRYAADVLAPAFGEAGPFLDCLGAIQTRLGAMQDSVVAIGLLSQACGRSSAMGYDAGRLVGVLAAERRSLGRGGDKAWRKLLRERPFWRIKSRRR